MLIHDTRQILGLLYLDKLEMYQDVKFMHTHNLDKLILIIFIKFEVGVANYA